MAVECFCQAVSPWTTQPALPGNLQNEPETVQVSSEQKSARKHCPPPAPALTLPGKLRNEPKIAFFPSDLQVAGTNKASPPPACAWICMQNYETNRKFNKWS